MNILSNEWINYFLTHYSILIGAIPYIVYKALKVVAILNPNVPTNLIKDLFTPRKLWE